MIKVEHTGFWNDQGEDILHAHSKPLVNWIIDYLKNDKDKPLYDFGCGNGQYLQLLQQAGFTNLTGFEGEPPTYKVFDNIKKQDLTRLFKVPQKGNCIFLEVAEHIPAKYKDIVLHNIIDACDDKLIMSWATRGQGGLGHINELNNDEVISLITDCGMIYLEDETKQVRDLIHPSKLDMPNGDLYWFKNSTLIFTKKPALQVAKKPIITSNVAEGKMNITIYTITYNEELMIQFMIDHYRSRFPNCNIIVYDNQSSDRTVEIAKANNCEVRYYNTNGKHDELMLWNTKNTAYKDSKTDWVLACDTDELLDINEDQLTYEDSNGVTRIKSECWQMVNKEDNFDYASIEFGYRDLAGPYNRDEYDKYLLFNKKYVDINYVGPGCHWARSSGAIKDSKRYKLLHYKYCNENFFVNKRAVVNLNRLNDRDKQNNWGDECLKGERALRDEYIYMKNHSVNVKNQMEHFYQNISGWFSYQDLYTDMVYRLPRNSHIVEVGAWKGASTAYLAVEIINSGKNIKLDVVDVWKSNENDPVNSNYIADIVRHNGDMLNVFKHNIELVKHVVNPIQLLSVDAAKLYLDKTLDFVFFDANPDGKAVREDIVSWLPKIKSGGWIGGHDYNHPLLPGITDTVKEIFGSRIVVVPGNFNPKCPNNQQIETACDSWLVQV